MTTILSAVFALLVISLYLLLVLRSIRGIREENRRMAKLVEEMRADGPRA